MDMLWVVLKALVFRVQRWVLIQWARFESYIKTRDLHLIQNRIRVNASYRHQPILLLALFQQGTLRPDLRSCIGIAKKMGYFVIGVNTASLPDDTQHQMDIYIQRPNVGRDFGSYQAGFLYMFAHGMDANCPLLMMMNDSVFFDATRLASFFNEIAMSTKEVLSATENFELQYHLGSFCIALKSSVLVHPRFHAFWEHYQLPEIRPHVIAKGEMALTACLKACVSSDDQLGALYDIHRVDVALNDAEKLAYALTVLPPAPDQPWDRHGVLESVRRGSQVHRSGVFLMYLGMPLIKIDGLYRGLYSLHTIDQFCQLIDTSQIEYLYALLTQRSFGGDHLSGRDAWNFYLGIR